LKTDGESEPAEAEIVSGSYFPTLGVRSAVGGYWAMKMISANAHPVVVLSFDYWKNRLAGDRRSSGTSVAEQLSDDSRGVAEQGFHGVEWSRLQRSGFPS